MASHGNAVSDNGMSSLCKLSRCALAVAEYGTWNTKHNQWNSYFPYAVILTSASPHPVDLYLLDYGNFALTNQSFCCPPHLTPR